MKAAKLFALFCAAVQPWILANAQAPDTPPSSLRTIVDGLTLDASGISPWHWVMDVTLYDHDGKNPQQGKVEAWFANGNMRSTLTLGSKTLSTLRVGESLYEAENQDAAAFVPLEIAFMEALRPVPETVLSLATAWKREPLSFGNAKLDCIEPKLPTVPSATISYDSPLAFCLSPSAGGFVASLQPAHGLLWEKQMGTFQSHRVSIAMDVLVSDKIRAEIKTTSLTAYVPMPDEFAIPPQYHPLDSRTATQADHAAAMILSKAIPTYPAAAREVHAAGTVQFDAVISAEGKIVSLKNTTTGRVHPALVTEAERVVRQWIYRPYLVDGVPVSLRTTITINFNIG